MDRMGVLTGNAKLWEPTPSFIFRIIFASKRSRQWKCFSPPYFARGVEEPYRNARKWAEQALEAWSPSEGRNKILLVKLKSVSISMSRVQNKTG